MSDFVKLGTVLRIMHGFAFKSENYVLQSQYRLITLGNFSEGENCFKYNDAKATYYGATFPDSFILSEGDLIMPLTEQTKGLFGNSAFIPKDDRFRFVLNQRVGKVICDEEKVDKKYIHFLLATEMVKKQLEARANGTKQRNISPDDVYDVEVILPDLDTQQKIGKLLYDLELKQHTNQSISSDLESITRLIHDYWFVQFDYPNEDGKPYKSSGGKMVWNNELKREIPEGWLVANLMENNLCSAIGTGVEYFKVKTYLPTGNIMVEAITDGEEVTYDNREGRANMQPVLYSVWFAKMKNSVKHISIPGNAEWFTDKYILSTGFVGLKCSDKTFAYMHSIIYSPYFEQHKNTLAHGATQEGVNEDDLKSIRLVVPRDRVLEIFAEKVNPLLEKKFSLLHENQQLSSLRDYLLPLLMNGQVTL